jgi:hypothetical protein
LEANKKIFGDYPREAKDWHKVRVLVMNYAILAFYLAEY